MLFSSQSSPKQKDFGRGDSAQLLLGHVERFVKMMARQNEKQIVADLNVRWHGVLGINPVDNLSENRFSSVHRCILAQQSLRQTRLFSSNRSQMFFRASPCKSDCLDRKAARQP